MGAACSPTFAQGFAANTTLQILDLSLNQLEDEGVVHFCKALETGGCLEQLNLSNNCISNRGASSMAQAIQKCQIMLQVLDLSYNKIGAKAATSLGQALSANSLLSTLQLDHNELGPLGGEGIAQGLLSKSLTTLTLGNNSLGDAGCLAIAKVLCSSPNIKKLDLSYNGV
jgi:Ran GTPase-activating protein (RanGAP) involved in mRNA processing and transport